MHNKPFWDFPGGPVAKNLPSNAGDTSSIPGRGTKTPHAKPMHHNKELAEPKNQSKKTTFDPKGKRPCSK